MSTTSNKESKEHQGYFTTEERLDRSHECNERCVASRLEHYHIPKVTKSPIVWHDFVGGSDE